MTSKRLASLLVLGVVILIVYAWWHTDDRPSVAAPPQRAAHHPAPGVRAEAASSEGGVAQPPVLPENSARAGVTRGQGDKEYAEANSALEQGNWESAYEWLEKTVAVAPGHARAWSDLSCACLGRGDPAALARGIAAATRALELDPKLWPALYNRACLHARLGEHDPALEDLAQAVTLAPKKVREAARDDTEFYPLRAEPRFMELVGQH